MPFDYIHWLSRIRRADEPQVGAKAADLGEISSLKLPIPNGFVISTSAYYYFLQMTGLRAKLEALLAHAEPTDTARLQQLAGQAQTLIRKATFPDDLADQILSAYMHLSAKNVHVAVRASVPDAEAHLIEIAQPAILNVAGSKNVLASVTEMWSSLFSAKSLYARAQSGHSQIGCGMAVIVQRMVEADVSGLLFTSDPMAGGGEPSLTIEAVWGLGEPMVNGELLPDHYELSRNDWSVSRKEIVRQEWQLSRGAPTKNNPGDNVRIPVSAAWQRRQKLTDERLVELAKMAMKLEKHFKTAQDCEWALQRGDFFFVQTRPVIEIEPVRETISAQELPIVPLLQGTPVSPGTASGAVRVIRGSQDLNKVRRGEVVVCATSDSSYDHAFSLASAIIVMSGGIASHASATARQLEIPAIADTGDVASLLHTGDLITVEGGTGYVFAGGMDDLHKSLAKPERAGLEEGHGETASRTIVPTKTATKILVNITEPSMSEEIAARDVDGVGLLRAEYMVAQMGEHPMDLIRRDKQDTFVSSLYDGLMSVAKAFSPRPVIYRAMDFTSRDFSRLAGGERYELVETNPLLGYRGARRFIGEPDVFKMELAAIRRARAYYKNIWLMAPFVRTPQELIAIKQMMADEGLYRSGSFKLYLMVEVPSTVLILDQFLGVGIDGVSIGSNDLTQLILGVDRDNPRVAELFDERNDAVLTAMEMVVRGAARHGIESSICGQAPSIYPEIVSKLVDWGISSISVSPESADAVRRTVAEAELATVRQRKNGVSRDIGSQ
jgi:pyruvate,water dikinase